MTWQAVALQELTALMKASELEASRRGRSFIFWEGEVEIPYRRGRTRA